MQGQQIYAWASSFANLPLWVVASLDPNFFSPLRNLRDFVAITIFHEENHPQNMIYTEFRRFEHTLKNLPEFCSRWSEAYLKWAKKKLMRDKLWKKLGIPLKNRLDSEKNAGIPHKKAKFRQKTPDSALKKKIPANNPESLLKLRRFRQKNTGILLRKTRFRQKTP